MFPILSLSMFAFCVLQEMNPKIDPKDSKTWNNKEWPSYFSVGIIKEYGIGQSEFMWAVRTLPGIRRFFEVKGSLGGPPFEPPCRM